MQKITIKPDVETRQQPVSWLNLRPDIMDFFQKSGMVTVGDVIARQQELPTEYLNHVKARFLGIDLN